MYKSLYPVFNKNFRYKSMECVDDIFARFPFHFPIGMTDPKSEVKVERARNSTTLRYSAVPFKFESENNDMARITCT